MAKRRKKDKKKEITKSEKNENSMIITNEMEKKLKILVEKNIPTKIVKKNYQNDSEISKAWVKRQKIKPFSNFHPHKNLWLVEQTREGVNQLIKAINSSKNFICLCSFLLEDEGLINALLSANERGIRVYILTTSNEFKKKLADIDSDYKIESNKRSIAHS